MPSSEERAELLKRIESTVNSTIYNYEQYRNVVQLVQLERYGNTMSLAPFSCTSSKLRSTSSQTDVTQRNIVEECGLRLDLVSQLVSCAPVLKDLAI